MFKLILKA